MHPVTRTRLKTNHTDMIMRTRWTVNAANASWFAKKCCVPDILRARTRTTPCVHSMSLDRQCRKCVVAVPILDGR
eukprot:1959282-Pyramimonas_sp.AAC.1